MLLKFFLINLQAEIVQLFDSISIIGGEEGVHIINTYEGRGKAYFQVESQVHSIFSII